MKATADAQEQFKDKEYQRRNNIQQGEKYPQDYDYAKYAMIKIANRFLMWPSQYGSDRAIAFFLPSRIPTITMPQPKEGHITVFFTDPYRHMPIDHYAEVQEALAQGNIKSWEKIRDGLEKVQLKKNDRGASLYMATNFKDFRGNPPTLFCSNDPINDKNNINTLSAGNQDMWNGIMIEFRFSNAYCQDWPEIYQHGISIIHNNVKEVQP